MSWVAAGLAGAQIGMGIYQNIKGNKEKKNAKRPELDEDIPEDIKQSLSMKQREALEGMPTAQKKEFIQNLDRAKATNMAGRRSQRGGLMGLGSMMQQEQDSLSSLFAADVQAREQKKAAAMQAQENVGMMKQQRQDMAFGLDQQAYEQQVASGQALVGAGMQNIAGGLSTGAGAAIESDKFGGKDKRMGNIDPMTGGAKTTPLPGSGSATLPAGAMQKRQGVQEREEEIGQGVNLLQSAFKFLG